MPPDIARVLYADGAAQYRFKQFHGGAAPVFQVVFLPESVFFFRGNQGDGRFSFFLPDSFQVLRQQVGQLVAGPAEGFRIVSLSDQVAHRVKFRKLNNP